MQRIAAFDPASPIMEMNITPLIDVMLVLLVMFIITIPIQTHAVKLDIPLCAACPEPDAQKNVITINATDQIAWNGTPVSEEGLRYLLRRTQQMQPLPELHLRADPTARYGKVDEVLATIKREKIRKFGLVGNEAYTHRF